jgi:hypothetical protein
MVKWVLPISLGVIVGANTCYRRTHGLDGPDTSPITFSQLRATVDELTPTLPKMVDADTEWTSIAAVPGSLIYSYRLVSGSLSNIPLNKRDAFRERLMSVVTKQVCESKETRDGMFARGVAVRIDYFDKSNSFIGSRTLDSQSCSAR